MVNGPLSFCVSFLLTERWLLHALNAAVLFSKMGLSIFHRIDVIVLGM